MGSEMCIRDSTMTVTIEGFDGSVDQTHQVKVSVPASTSQMVWSVPRAQIPVNGSHYIWVEGSVLPANRLFLTRIGDLNLPEAHLDVKVDVTEPTTATVTVATTTFAYFVRVLTPWPGARPDISALDLRPGTKAVVTVTGLPEGFDPDEITVRHFLDDVDR